MTHMSHAFMTVYWMTHSDQSWQNQSDHWAACGKEAQSPIDIQSNTAETHSGTVTQL